MHVRDLRSGEVLLAHRDHEVHRTASIGKLLLLEQVAVHPDQDELLDRRDVEPVADSGLWQHLRTDVLPVHDVALLVASVSDNLATNVLLHRFGLPLPCGSVVLHDRVRDHRTAEHPSTLSSGTAHDLVDLVAGLSERVRLWLRTSTDLSMVASALDLDPLAHTAYDLVSKTGTDDTIRAEVGQVGDLAYAVLVEWDADHDGTRGALRTMRLIGEQLRGRLQR